MVKYLNNVNKQIKFTLKAHTYSALHFLDLIVNIVITSIVNLNIVFIGRVSYS